MTRSTTVDPSAIDASLHLLAHQVLHDLVDETLEPCLLHVAERHDTVDLGVRPLDGAHPTELLLGFTAPADWHALGIATAGWAYDVADRATAAPDRSRVHVVTIVSRSGEVVYRTHAEDHRLLGSATDDDDVSGEQIDLLRRALDLPTAGAPCGTDVFFTIEWLATLLALERETVTTWDEVVALHPARRILQGARSSVARDHGLVVTATMFARAWPWSRLRQMAGRGTHLVPDLDQTAARWLDDGAFARFVLNRCPPLSLVRARIRSELVPTLADRVEQALEEMRIPHTAWPDAQAV
ncbi:hypothetical protein [Actinospongicola halichondriae]|uniref:hypothetical protein n=1 Tax=Actinospongicola halichondriae TaxID=3236844 RepID=UPI003D56D4AA